MGVQAAYTAVNQLLILLGGVGMPKSMESQRTVIQALERCAASDDVTPEERMHYADMISEIVRNAGSSLKDSKVVNWRRFCAYSVTILAGLGIMASIIGGNVNIKLPSQKA